ncbi:homoserine dehydrogenase [Diaphorobacter nitroreducens]|uniref:homoserine dehydrogenase n=1 Tax=Diaphorobacter nitroreducens TaxID=164759 RepID=UPI0035AF3F23
MFVEPQLSPSPEVHASARRAPAPPPALRVGMIGAGTVGSGVWRVLRRNQDLINARAGRAIEIVAVAARNTARAAAALDGAPGVRLLADPLQLATDPGVDVVLELAGGTGAARDWVQAALVHGKHVVTANKALLATHGEALAQTAARHGRVLAYEAAVAGSVPVIKALREGLAANRITALAGVLNGTSNYILTRMQAAGLGFAAALTEAQALGYAEADPAFDVDGTDAAHKLALLAANAFGMPVRLDAVHVEGIRDLQRGDVAAAAHLGYAVKLLAVAEQQECEGRVAIQLRVHPALVPARHPLALLDGATNGLLVHSDAAGSAFFSGAGAGGEPTASAVLADRIDLARLPAVSSPTPTGPGVPTLGTHRRADAPAVLPMASVKTPHLLRLLPGAALCETAVLRALARDGVTVRRRTWAAPVTPGGAPELLLLTAPTPDALAAEATARLQTHTGAQVRRLRVELCSALTDEQ